MNISQIASLYHNTDPHEQVDPFNHDQVIKQCCRKVQCHSNSNFCFSAMSEKGIWGACDEEHGPTLSSCSNKWPWANDINDKMAFIKAKSAGEIKEGCCQSYCHTALESKNLKCPAGQIENYFGTAMKTKYGDYSHYKPTMTNKPWSAMTNKEITDTCCYQPNQCSVILDSRVLSCDHVGRAPRSEYVLAALSTAYLGNIVCV